MLYRQKFETFIRRYGDIGYIANRGNSTDRVVDASGAVFLDALSREPKSLTALTEEISKAFTETPPDFESDVAEFYRLFEEDGFIVSGETIDELDVKDIRFSYNDINPKTMRSDFSPKILRSEKNTQSFLSAHFKDRPQLVSLQIELTSLCNERCIHCYIPHENRTNDMPLELYDDVLRQASEMGVLGITLSGGEPLLHKDFLEILKHTKKYDFSIGILSNMTLLNDEILYEMKSAHISIVGISLYSMDSEIHDKITQAPGSHKKTIHAIEKLIANDIPIQIHCPIMRQNKTSYKDVLRWATDRKISAVPDYVMMARYDRSNDNLDNRLRLDEIEPLVRDILSGDKAYRERICRADFDAALSRDVCDEPICGVCISAISMVANGNLYPCAGWQSFVLGNIKERSLRDIWDNAEPVQYLRGIRKKDFPDCIKCQDRNFCAMCLVRNANESPTGNLFDTNKHFCEVAALNRKVVENWLLLNN